ncbi:MAG TPA: UMP kinase [Clostridia bacterium]|nr:UMP kinase [Clostridia bacterium]
MMKYRRLLLKISGESLAGDSGNGIEPSMLTRYASIVKSLWQDGHEVGIVVGGGNFWRGRKSVEMDRMAADKMGMLATVMNSIALADALQRQEVPTRVMSAIPLPTIGEPMNGEIARRHLAKGRVVVFAGGTGSPFFSTDSAAALRASEIKADVIMKATLVDGVYDKDPLEHSDAMLLKELTFSDILTRKLKVIDATAAALCRDYGLKLIVFNGTDPATILQVAGGAPIGTLVAEVAKHDN